VACHSDPPPGLGSGRASPARRKTGNTAALELTPTTRGLWFVRASSPGIRSRAGARTNRLPLLVEEAEARPGQQGSIAGRGPRGNLVVRHRRASRHRCVEQVEVAAAAGVQNLARARMPAAASRALRFASSTEGRDVRTPPLVRLGTGLKAGSYAFRAWTDRSFFRGNIRAKKARTALRRILCRGRRIYPDAGSGSPL